MGMTKEERNGKAYIERLLKKQGYPTYAKIFDKFEFHFTSDPSHIAYLSPKTGEIVINREVDADQCSVLVRHEILHAYLQHHKRMIEHLAKLRGLDPDKLDDMTIKEFERIIYTDPYRLDNIAGDYEISNRGYTAKDKQAVRNILINGQTVSGLVTEDDHPEWTNLSIEEMYDLLKKEIENKVTDGILLDETTFVDPDTGIVYGVGELNM